jgi:hypothetical protein
LCIVKYFSQLIALDESIRKVRKRTDNPISCGYINFCVRKWERVVGMSSKLLAGEAPSLLKLECNKATWFGLRSLGVESARWLPPGSSGMLVFSKELP